MSAEENNVTNAGAESVQDTTQSSKGKGKAPVANHSEEDHSMAMEDDEESSSDEEPGPQEDQEEAEEADEDNMEEIDTDNIISGGRRTRGKAIDFAKAAEGLEDDDDEDDDADFQDPDDEMKD